MGHRAGLLLLIAAAGLAACGEDAPEREGSGPTVVATTTQVGDMVRAVAGDRARVTQLLSANVDPHGYEPRPSEARRMADAALVIRSGGDLDEWVVDLARSNGNAKVVDLMRSVKPLEGGHAGEERQAGEESEVDPHWWQDPRNGVAATEAIREQLTRADPGGRRGYEVRARRYARRLGRLDHEIASCLSQVPAAKRKLVTTHDALGYFARRYDVDVIGALIPSLSSRAQPSARDTERLVDQIRGEGVEAIFPESSLSPRLERAVAREAGVVVGGSLWADTLGPPGSAGATYLGSLADNAGKLARGLSGGRLSCRPAS